MEPKRPEQPRAIRVAAALAFLKAAWSAWKGIHFPFIAPDRLDAGEVFVLAMANAPTAVVWAGVGAGLLLLKPWARALAVVWMLHGIAGVATALISPVPLVPLTVLETALSVIVVALLFSGAAATALPRRPARPIGVTVLAALYLLIGTLAATLGFGIAVEAEGRLAQVLSSVAMLASVVLPTAVGAGLWGLQSWSRLVAMALSAIGLVASLYGLVAGGTAADGLLAPSISVLVALIILWYLGRKQTRDAFAVVG